MTEEILVNVTFSEVRIAFLSSGVVREVFVERRAQQGIAGNIYSGRVRRLLPGLQAAFIDLGSGRPGFLHSKEMSSGSKDVTASDASFIPPLQLHLGDRLPVQVIKDPLGTKGARLSTYFSIPGRLLVLTPGVFRTVVSQKMTDASERERLLAALKPSRFGGYIVRTMAAGVSNEALHAEQQLLDTAWEKVLERMRTAKPGACLHKEPPLACRVLRDLAGEAVSLRVRVDHPAMLQEMLDYASYWCPTRLSCIELYDGEQPIFESAGVEKVVQQALYRRVYLKSGGYLVFDQTEAMTTVDVNTGSTLSMRRSDDTVSRTNQEAVGVIAHQVRLRNLGGIIIIDFIDMTSPALREHLLSSLKDAFKDDTAHTEFSELTRLGLVQMTRKRARESLLHTVCEPCPQCQRRGMIRTTASVAYDILRAIQSKASNPWEGFRIQLAPEVAGYFLQDEPEALAQLEARLGKTVELSADPRYGREKWDILPLGALQ